MLDTFVSHWLSWVWEANPTGNEQRCGIAHKAHTNGQWAEGNRAMNDMTSNKRKISADLPIDQQIANLLSLIKNAPENSRICEFTPELAEYILANININNRPRKSTKIVDYKRDMQANNWSLTGETIKFGTDGHLKDGQNRLAACMQAQVPFTSHAIFGIDPSTFHHMDTGKNRTGQDVLAIMGVKNAAKISLLIKFLLNWDKANRTDTRSVVSNQEVKDAYLKRFDKKLLQESVSWGQKVYNQTRFPLGQISATYYVGTENGYSAQIEEFYNLLMSQTGKVRSPQIKLQKHLTSMRNERLFISSHAYSVLLSRAVHCHLNKVPMTNDMLRVTQSDRRMPMGAQIA